jgi:hypothetical protein
MPKKIMNKVKAKAKKAVAKVAKKKAAALPKLAKVKIAKAKTATPKPKLAKLKGKVIPMGHAIRPRLTPVEATRSLPRTRPSTYLSAGALGVAVSFVIFFGYQTMVPGTSPQGDVAESRTPANTKVADQARSTEVTSEESSESVSENGAIAPAEKKDLTAKKSKIEESKIEQRSASQSAGNGALAAEFKIVEKMPLAKRIGFWSKYIERSLPGRDKVKTLVDTHEVADVVPLIPVNYDCTTFVETVAALSRSANADAIFSNLISIRYKNGQPSYANRNHFPELDWIPNNQKAEILADITSHIAELGGVHAKVEKNRIDRKKWLSAQLKAQGISREVAAVTEKVWAKSADAKVSYIEITDVKKVLNDIPDGAVINLVHRNDGHHPVLITHQGFVIRDGNQVLLRHASRGGRIRTNDLYDYLRGLMKQQNPTTNWPLIGVNFNQIKDSTSANNLRSETM